MSAPVYEFSSEDETIDVFRRSAITRPLFEEPSSEIERVEPWSGPKGFMIGGMALPTKHELGQQYFDAANLLIEAIRAEELEDYRLANPVLYLYRHWLELTLKSLVGSGTHGHDLDQLARAFEATTRDRFGQDVPGWISARLKEIAAVDPNSTAFRYGENRDKQLKCSVPVDGEIYISLNHLQAVMTALHAALTSVWHRGGFSLT